MIRFRRLAPIVALLALVSAIALATPPAGAPVVSCGIYNQQTARLRQESQTELLPAITLSCTVYDQLPNTGTPRTSGTLYDWQVTFPANAPLTVSPAMIGGASEPQLTVEVVPYGLSTDEGTYTFYAAKSGIYAATGASGGAVIFSQVNMNPAGDHSTAAAPDTVYISIENLRVSALGLASNPPYFGGPLVLTLWASPSQTKNAHNLSNPGNIFLPLLNGVQQPTVTFGLGYAAPSLQVSIVSSPPPPPPSHPHNHGGHTPPPSNYQYFGVDFAGLYSYAFAPPVDGWESPTKDGGTRLAFVFSNGSTDPNDAWPSYIDLFVPATIEVRDPVLGIVVVANYVQSPNADGSGGTVMPIQTGTYSPNSTFLGANAAVGAYSSPQWVNITGTTLIVYEIAAVPPALAAVTTTLEVVVRGEIVAPPTIYPPPDDPTAQVTITMAGFAPWTPAPTVQTAPIPRFVVPSAPIGGPLL